MSEAREKKRNIFERESNILKESKKFLEREGLSAEECIAHLRQLNQDYEDIVDQSKLITKVSDRLQKKINRVNDELEDKNVALQDSLDALTKAKVGRKATTIVLVIFIVVFIVVEGFVEPYIESWTRESFMDGTEDNSAMITTVTLFAKGALALLLRPIEKVVEKILMKQAQEAREKELASSS